MFRVGARRDVGKQLTNDVRVQIIIFTSAFHHWRNPVVGSDINRQLRRFADPFESRRFPGVLSKDYAIPPRENIHAGSVLGLSAWRKGT